MRFSYCVPLGDWKPYSTTGPGVIDRALSGSNTCSLNALPDQVCQVRQWQA
ncbi:hypothetical protein ACFOKI_12690 [Sphingomonas qilianensis]|uniref:Uncharacterized protein n=1 Tax=Sphingomonas qilianensis TaxID=1736690 RepID=A0ABU9XNJ7_9SPHN